MSSVDKTNQEWLVDQLSTMEERPHENLVLVANSIMQYKWFRPNKSEQEVVNQCTIQFKAHMAVEDGSDCESLVGQVMEQGGCNFQPNNMPNKLQKSSARAARVGQVGSNARVAWHSPMFGEAIAWAWQLHAYGMAFVRQLIGNHYGLA